MDVESNSVRFDLHRIVTKSSPPSALLLELVYINCFIMSDDSPPRSSDDDPEHQLIDSPPRSSDDDPEHHLIDSPPRGDDRWLKGRRSPGARQDRDCSSDYNGDTGGRLALGPTAEDEVIEEEHSSSLSKNENNETNLISQRETPVTTKFSYNGENRIITYGVSSMQGWCSSMDDAIAAVPDLSDGISFFGVYDGHAGKHPVSKFCARYLHSQVLKLSLTLDIENALKKGFLRIDEMLIGQKGWNELALLGDKTAELTGMLDGSIWSPGSSDSTGIHHTWPFEKGPQSNFPGPNSLCTACVVLVEKNKLIAANVGDSRCVLSREGQAMSLSTEHRPELQVESDRISKAGGFIKDGRVNGILNISRAIGGFRFKQNMHMNPENQVLSAYPDITVVHLSEDDCFCVLACDAVWDCMSSQQLVDFIGEHLKTEACLSAICERVFDRCLEISTAGERSDNMVMILIKFKKAPI